MKCPTCGHALKGKLTDSTEEWRARLAVAFPDVDLEAEMAKMRRWILLHPGRNMTRRFVEKWLERADRTVVEVAQWAGIQVGDPEAERRDLDALRSRKR